MTGTICVSTSHSLSRSYLNHLVYSIRVKGKVRPRTGHKGPEWEMYSSTLSLTSALDWGGGSKRHAPAALPHGITRYPLHRGLDGNQERSGPVRKILPQPGFDSRTSSQKRVAIPTTLFGPSCICHACCLFDDAVRC